jgi:hypothetical protein
MPESDWTIGSDGDIRWQGILAHQFSPSGFSRPATPGVLLCEDCWETESTPVHQPPPPQEDVIIPVTSAQQRAARALARHRIATGRPVPDDLQAVASAPQHLKPEPKLDYTTYCFVTTPSGPALEHTTCDEIVCEIDEGDSLATILTMINYHRQTCPEK